MEWIGCRDVVDYRKSGFLCRIRDAIDLAGKGLRILDMRPTDRVKMGARNRKKAVHEFNERIVVSRNLSGAKCALENHLQLLKPSIERISDQ